MTIALSADGPGEVYPFRGALAEGASHPARPRTAAGHALLNLDNTAEADLLQCLLGVGGAIAGSADDGDGGVHVTVNAFEDVRPQSLLRDVDALCSLFGAGLAPSLRMSISVI